MSNKERKRPTIRRQGRYGEQTVLRRVPLSVVPLLDCLLDKMARAAANDPRKTLQRVADTVQKLADEEQAKDDRQALNAKRYIDKSIVDNLDLEL